MAAGAEFVEGWLVAQVLGEGAYGEVRLLVHARSGAAVALKLAHDAAGAAREAALHRALRHPHVLRCLGERTHQGLHYLFLEYAPGGELFDRIEPDVGMGEAEARRYWRQLLSGLQYLHGRGVAHRDIKPENLLLDNHDQLKISDFGMATLFRHGARERLLTRVCGTPPYAAPEVLRAARCAYRAPPADLWPAALVLLAMLAGELPWERACESDERYAAWSAWAGAARRQAAPRGPWRKLSAPALALLRRALQPLPSRRAPLPALLQLPWLRDTAEAASRAWRSQPDAAPDGAAAPDASAAPDAPSDLSAADMDALICRSQPAQPDDLRLSGAPLGRRMTRVWLRGDEAQALAALGAALRARGLAARRLQPRVLAVQCGELRMRVSAARAGPDTLLEFRRTRGCGLQFKRRFVELRDALRALHAPPRDS